VVSVVILVVSVVILDIVSAGAIVESFVTVVVVEVESFVVSVLEEPPLQDARNAETQTIIRNFFILI